MASFHDWQNIKKALQEEKGLSPSIAGITSSLSLTSDAMKVFCSKDSCAQLCKVTERTEGKILHAAQAAVGLR